MAELLDCAPVIVPPMASVLSALGTLVSPVRLDLVRSAPSPLATLEWGAARPPSRAPIAEPRSSLRR